LVPPARPPLRPRPPRPLHRPRPGRPARPDVHRQPRAPVPTPSPDEDPRRLDLHHGRTRRLPLDQPARTHLATRPHRHHRPHPTTGRPTRPTTGRPTTPTNQLTPTPPHDILGGASGVPSPVYRRCPLDLSHARGWLLACRCSVCR